MKKLLCLPVVKLAEIYNGRHMKKKSEIMESLSTGKKKIETWKHGNMKIKIVFKIKNYCCKTFALRVDQQPCFVYEGSIASDPHLLRTRDNARAGARDMGGPRGRPLCCGGDGARGSGWGRHRSVPPQVGSREANVCAGIFNRIETKIKYKYFNLKMQMNICEKNRLNVYGLNMLKCIGRRKKYMGENNNQK